MLIDWFLKRTFTVNLISIVIVIAGALAFWTTKVDVIPQVEMKSVLVSASIPYASPIEMESQLVIPMENSISKMPMVKKFSSSSNYGYATITITLDSSVKNVEKAVSEIKASLDPIVQGMSVQPRTFEVKAQSINEIFLASIAFMNSDPINESHRIYAKNVEAEILKLPGVSSTHLTMPVKQLTIVLNPKKLTLFGLSTASVQSQIVSSLRIPSIGQIKKQGKQITIGFPQSENDLSFFSSIPIRNNLSGREVRLNELATVKLGYQETESIRLINDKELIELTVQKNLHSNLLELNDLVVSRLSELEKGAPGGIKLFVVQTSASFLQKQIDVLKTNGLLGILIVALMLGSFLGFKTALATSIGVPLAYFATGIVLQQLGVSIDMISIIGMILIIGILVDDAIIVAERFSELRDKGFSPIDSASQAAKSLMRPVTGTVATTIIAFCPILEVDGSIRDWFWSIPLVIMIALTVSWFECFYILPNHLKDFEPKNKVLKKSRFKYFEKKYHSFLILVVKNRYIVAFLGLLFLGGSGFLAVKIQKSFDLSINSVSVRVLGELKHSDNVQESLKQMKPISDFVRTLQNREEVSHVVTRIGKVWMNGTWKESPKVIQIQLFLKEGIEKENQKKEILEELVKQKITSIDRTDFTSLSTERVSAQSNEESGDNKIKIFVKGGNPLQYSKLRQNLSEQLKNTPLLIDLNLGDEHYNEKWEFNPFSGELLRYGVSLKELSNQIRVSTQKEWIENIKSGAEDLSLNIQSGDVKELKFEDLNRIQILTQRGEMIPIRYLGRWEKTMTLRQVDRTNGFRTFEAVLTFDIKNGDMTTFTQSINNKLDPIKRLYPNMLISTKPFNDNISQNRKDAIKIVAYCILGVLFVLALVLGSIVKPLLVSLAIPFGLSGVIVALYTHGMDLGLMAIIGTLGVIGVAVNDSLVMVSTIDEKKRDHPYMSFQQAIISGASSRLRAIILTSITTLGGVFPMAYDIGGESGFTKPVAFALGWGVLSSTLLTLIVLPACLAIYEDFKGFMGRIFFRKKINSRKMPIVPHSSEIPAEQTH